MQGGSTSNAPSPPRDRERRPTESNRDRDDVPLSNQPSASISRPSQQYPPPTGPSGRSSSQRDRGEPPPRSDNADRERDRDRDRDRRDGGGISSRGGGGGGQTASTHAGDSGSLAERTAQIRFVIMVVARIALKEKTRGSERSKVSVPSIPLTHVLTCLKIARVQMTIHLMVHLSGLRSTGTPALVWARSMRTLDVPEEGLDVTEDNIFKPTCIIIGFFYHPIYTI